MTIAIIFSSWIKAAPFFGLRSGRRLGRVDGIRNLLTMLRQASARSEGAGDADTDERGRLGRGPDGVPGGAAAAGRQGAGRPQVSERASLFHRSQHHVAGSAGRVRGLERRLEALLAAQSVR